MYVKGKGKFTTNNPSGAPSWEEANNHEENSWKKDGDDNKKLNPVQYSRKASVSKLKRTSSGISPISKQAPGGVLIIEELSLRAWKIARGTKNRYTHHFFTRINPARTEPDHARTEPFLREIFIYFVSKRNSKQTIIWFKT